MKTSVGLKVNYTLKCVIYIFSYVITWEDEKRFPQKCKKMNVCFLHSHEQYAFQNIKLDIPITLGTPLAVTKCY